MWCLLAVLQFFEVKEIHKPEGQWCQHCQLGKGCGIYAQRPHECRVFDCNWLIGLMPEHWYPKRSHMVVKLDHDVNSVSSTMFVIVDDRYPNIWKTEPYYQNLRHMSRQGLNRTSFVGYFFTVVRLNSRPKNGWLILPDQEVEWRLGEPMEIRQSGNHFRVVK